jgi:tryptophan-rich sensory protein
MFSRASWLSLLPFALVCFAAGWTGSLFTRSSVNTWYRQLKRPPWNPPNWVFGQVWGLLYLLMAVSSWLVWRQAGWRDAKFPLLLFGIQLLLNVTWSAVFFGKRAIGAAFGEILLLWTMTIATAVAFYPISFLAVWLLIPYIAWVGFASYLNFRIWQMN